jgi:hypothetical protein
LCDGDLSQYLPCARAWHRTERRRPHVLPLQLAPDAVEQTGADLGRLVTSKLDRDRAQKRIAHQRIERCGEVHQHIEFGNALAEHAIPLLGSAERSSQRTFHIRRD